MIKAYCHDPRHATPCPHEYGKPCEACVQECDPKYLKERCDAKTKTHVTPHQGCILR